MKPRLFSPRESGEIRFNITSSAGSAAYPRFLSPIAQGTYADPPTSSDARIDLQSKYDGPKTLANILSESIGEALTEVLGSRTREAIYDYMERKHSVSRNEIPEHLGSLFALFEDTFGLGGKKVIGRVIARKVYAKLDWKFEPSPNLEFADYMEKIKNKIGSEALEQDRSATESGK